MTSPSSRSLSCLASLTCSALVTLTCPIYRECFYGFDNGNKQPLQHALMYSSLVTAEIELLYTLLVVSPRVAGLPSSPSHQGDSFECIGHTLPLRPETVFSSIRELSRGNVLTTLHLTKDSLP